MVGANAYDQLTKEQMEMLISQLTAHYDKLTDEVKSKVNAEVAKIMEAYNRKS